MNKPCIKCGEEFTPTEAQIAKRHWICRDCRKVQNAESRARRKIEGKPVSGSKMPREYHANYEASYNTNPVVRLRKSRLAKKYREGPNRHKHEARWKVSRALKGGRLKKLPCEVCGNPESQAHHDDYNRPLDVRWLCRQHHANIHAKAKGQL